MAFWTPRLVMHPSTFLVLLLVALSLAPSRGVNQALHRPTVIMVSFDGFRYDYMDLHPSNTKTFHKMALEGVRMELSPQFTSKTFPNHWSLVTGQHEESHGIVGNTMYDPTRNASFNMGSHEPYWWDAAIPLWAANERQGGVSASYFWPGSEVKFGGRHMSYFARYDRDVRYQDRVDQVLNWLSLPQPPEFITLYFEEPDHTGHAFGPDSHEIIDALQRADDVLSVLVDGLRSAGALDTLNLIVTSDHGMTSTRTDRLISLGRILAGDLEDAYFLSDEGAIASIWPDAGFEEQIYSALVNAQNPNMVVYRKPDIPPRLHYSNNVRIAPIVCIAMEGWTIIKKFHRDVGVLAGNHGYDPAVRSMHPLFLARGPAFRAGLHHLRPVDNVEIYGLLSTILCLQPDANNGTLTVDEWSGFGILSPAFSYPCNRQNYNPDPTGTLARKRLSVLVGGTCAVFFIVILILRAVYSAAAQINAFVRPESCPDLPSATLPEASIPLLGRADTAP